MTKKEKILAQGLTSCAHLSKKMKNYLSSASFILATMADMDGLTPEEFATAQNTSTTQPSSVVI